MGWMLLETSVVRSDVGSEFGQNAELSRRIACAKDKSNGDDEPVAPDVRKSCGYVRV